MVTLLIRDPSYEPNGFMTSADTSVIFNHLILSNMFVQIQYMHTGLCTHYSELVRDIVIFVCFFLFCVVLIYLGPQNNAKHLI